MRGTSAVPGAVNENKRLFSVSMIMNPAMLLKCRELGGSVRQNKRLLRRCPVTRDLLPLVARFDESVGGDDGVDAMFAHNHNVIGNPCRLPRPRCRTRAL